MANPAPRLEVQFTNRDRLHVHIVTHFLQPRDRFLRHLAALAP
jgi:hypothetical protein